MALGNQNTMRGADTVAAYSDAMPLMLSFAPNWKIRTIVFQVIGTALVFSAAGMWLMPGSQVTADLMLIKLGASLFFFLCGLALLMRNHSDNQPDAYFDPIRSEVRVLQKNDRGRPQMVLCRSYESLGSVVFKSTAVELFDIDGSLLMRLLISDPEVRMSLRMQLCGQVKMTA
jgi:hypothetical protein